MDDHRFRRLANLVDDFVSGWSDVCTNPNPFVPAEHSAAAAERGVDDEMAGQIGYAYVMADMVLGMVHDHLRSILVLLDPPVTGFGVAVLARAVVESCARAWYLLEPGIGRVERVRRVMNESLHNQCELKLKEQGFDLATAARLDFAEFPDRNASMQDLIAEGKSYGFDATKPTKLGFVSLGEGRPTPTTLVPQMVGAPLGPILYGYLSGYTHGAPFAAMEGVQQSAIPDDPEGAFLDFTINPRSFELAVGGALLGPMATVERQLALYGRTGPSWSETVSVTSQKIAEILYIGTGK